MFTEDYNWRVEAELGGKSRALADVGQHWCDLAEFVTGLSIEKVLADYGTILPERKKPLGSVETFSSNDREYQKIKIDTEDRATTLLRFKQGVRGGKNYFLYKDPENMPESLKSYVNYPAGYLEGYADAVKNILLSYYQSIENKKGIKYPDFADGHRCMQIIEAILESGKEGKWIWIDI